MNEAKLITALETLQNPVAILETLKAESTGDVPQVDAAVLKEAAPELLIAIAEAVAMENAVFGQLHQDVLNKNKEAHRGLTDILPYMENAYHFTKDHWAEIFFVLNYLNRKGHLKKVRSIKSLNTFFETFFDEESKKKK